MERIQVTHSDHVQLGARLRGELDRRTGSQGSSFGIVDDQEDLARKEALHLKLPGSPAETGPLGIPEEDYAPALQTTHNADQMPLSGILLVEQRLQLALRFVRDFTHVLGVVASVRLTLSGA